MIIRDAKCKDCDHVFLVNKNKATDNFSDYVYECPECHSENTYVLFGIGDVDVAVGIHGNGHTKFDKEFVYKPSRYGKFKGTKV